MDAGLDSNLGDPAHAVIAPPMESLIMSAMPKAAPYLLRRCERSYHRLRSHRGVALASVVDQHIDLPLFRHGLGDEVTASHLMVGSA